MEPTQEPIQRFGYAITIGDGAYVRNWPSTTSVIIAELPANKVVYVNGQTYVDGVAWHDTQYEGSEKGYIRADMLRMMSAQEVLDYLDNINATPEPAPTEAVITAPPYNPNSLSSYGYVSASTVNFRTKPDTKSARIRQLKQYAFCLVLGSEQVDGTTWYKVSYDKQIGYISGNYFKQMTLAEMENFVNSAEYTQGVINNTAQTDNTSGGGSSGQSSKGTTGEIISAEDQKVETWVNPNSTIQVSYEPFDPFATPEPLKENEITNTEYLDGLAEQVLNGTLTEEKLEVTLKSYYRDAADPEGTLANALAYIHGKTAAQATETPEATPDVVPLATDEVVYPQEETRGSAAGWVIGLAVLAAAGGGGYAWYAAQQKKRRAAAQQAAQKRAALQKKQQAAQQGKPGAQPAGTPAASAQNANKARGNASGPQRPSAPAAGTTVQGKPEAPVQSGSGEAEGQKNYSSAVKNPYGRYTTGAEEDNAYTASFKPAGKNGSEQNAYRRRNRGAHQGREDGPQDGGQQQG